MPLRPACLALVTYLTLGEISVGGELPGSGHRVAVDLYGDPLPNGALVRMGTIRLRLEGDGQPSPVVALAFTLDGKAVVSADEHGAVCRWNPTTGQALSPRSQERGDVFRGSYALSPDGCYLAREDSRGTNKLWNLITGKEIFRGSYWLDAPFRSPIAFSPNGSLLVGSSADNSVRLWKTETGVELTSLALARVDLEGLALSHDGKILAGAIASRDRTTRTVHLWEAASGKELRRFPTPARWVYSLVFSPDDKVLAASGLGMGIGLWDTAAGNYLLQVEGTLGAGQAVAFSPDGRSLAFSTSEGKAENYPVYLAEVATGKVRCRWIGHRGAVASLAFSRDTMPGPPVLASGSMDTTILLWDLLGQSLQPDREASLPAKEQDRLWADLSDMDASRAFRAIQTLEAHPASAARLLRERLRPAPALDRHRISRWIADLDSNLFPVRDEARMELERCAELAEPTLRRALASHPPLHMRRQLEQLLEQLAGWTPEGLRGLRAIEGLERIDTVEARQVLENLAGGAPEARLTQEAKATLQRLARRMAGP
jgi:hypothetical protein